MNQRGFLTAHKGAGSQTQLYMEAEAAAENVLAQKSQLPRLIDGNFQALYGDGIFSTDINIPGIGSNRISGNGHRFQYGMRIAFQDGSIHERTRIAFIGIADDIFVAWRLICRKLPFHPGRKSATASAPQAGSLDLIDDLLRRHFRQRLAQRLIAITSDVLADFLRIDHPAIVQSDALLLSVETNLTHVEDFFLRHLIDIGQFQPLNRTAFQKVFGNNFFRILRFDMAIEDLFRVNRHDRSFLAQTETAGFDDLDFFTQAVALQRFFQAGGDVRRVG